MKKEIKTNFLKKTIATMLLFVMVFQFIPNIAIGFTDLEKTKEEFSYPYRVAERNLSQEPKGVTHGLS